MSTPVAGLVFNIQKYSLHDGPGIRTTVFLKGCPLRCAWCHSPESQDAQPEFMPLADRCVRCGSACAQDLEPRGGGGRMACGDGGVHEAGR